MKIAKVLNNNIAVAVNDYGHDVIIMGRGVAYQKRFGDPVDDALVERIFHENADDLSARYKDLFGHVPEEYFDVAATIVGAAEERLSNSLSESLLFVLADHIHFAVQRASQGIPITNGLLDETRMAYAEEYAIGKEALALIHATFDVAMPDDEAAFVALHIVEGTLGATVEEAVSLTRIVAGSLEIIAAHLGRDLPRESVDVYRLIVHLKLFARRVLMGEKEGIGLADGALMRSIRTSYPEAFRCANKVIRAVRKDTRLSVSEDERIYLTIHIERLRQSLLGGGEAMT